ncbi:MAG: hypothetical protein COB46_11980 [Rhodospirillaceae bacterium]|nr:MAG: hypothetical protein COB46_11980 [Rhodospirillaceae bacterium]
MIIDTNWLCEKTIMLHLQKRVCTFLIVLVWPFLSLAETGASERLLYDDAWWEERYATLPDTPDCQVIITNIEEARNAERALGRFYTPFLWALDKYFNQEKCITQNPDEAITIFTDLAERGEGLATVYLAHIYHAKYGPNAPITQSWLERAKPAMVRVISENWRKNFYHPAAKTFQKIKMPFSPELESVFLWGEETLNGDPEKIYQIGMDLLKHSSLPEAKVLACGWFFKARIKKHVKARFQQGRQLALGDGVKVNSRKAEMLLELSANVDHNVNAFLLAAQLLQRGDIFHKHLPDAYFALLKAQALGANVSEQLQELAPQLTDKERWHANKNAEFKPSLVDLEPKAPQARQPICSYSSR